MTNSIKKNHEDQTIKQRQQQEEENNHQLPNITSIITTSTSFSDLEQEQEDQEEQQLNDDDDINVVKNFDDNQYVDVSNPSKQQHEQSLVIISWNLFCCFMAWAFTVSIATLGMCIGLSLFFFFRLYFVLLQSNVTNMIFPMPNIYICAYSRHFVYPFLFHNANKRFSNVNI